MTDWTPVETQAKAFGPYIRVYLEPPDGTEGGHEVRFPTGDVVRVYPDGHTSGQKRSKVIGEALTSLVALDGALAALDPAPSPVAYLLGMLSLAGLDWTRYPPALAEVTIEEWLAEWLEAGGSAWQLLDDLDTDGWEIVRKGES